ncbi:putative replication protein A, OB [Helianthus anomalus]
MGKIEDTIPGTTKKGKQYLRIKLTDISGSTIDVTLWEEVLPRFDRQAMLSAEEPVVAAFTSLKVTIFKGHTSEKLQLSSTPATHIYFNPTVDSAIETRNRFKDGTQLLLTATPGHESHERHLRTEDRNKRTISELLEHQKENQGQTFNCKASITTYIKGRPWYYTMCPQCPRKIIQTKRGWSCGSHQNLPEPKFM